MNRSAATALLTLVLLPGVASAQEDLPLGRLFLSPQERAQLDRQRNNPNPLTELHQGEQNLTLNGVVRRSSGRGAHWVNGQAHWDSASPRPPVPIGDTYRRSTGERESLLKGGKIVVHQAVKP